MPPDSESVESRCRLPNRNPSPNVEQIIDLEERLKLAELAPDPGFFETYLADEAMLDGQLLKSKVVEAHRPTAGGPKFTSVEMSDYRFVDHGAAVVVTCVGKFEGAAWSGTLKFMRVWAMSSNSSWKIIAGSTAPA